MHNIERLYQLCDQEAPNAEGHGGKKALSHDLIGPVLWQLNLTKTKGSGTRNSAMSMLTVKGGDDGNTRSMKTKRGITLTYE